MQITIYLSQILRFYSNPEQQAEYDKPNKGYEPLDVEGILLTALSTFLGTLRPNHPLWIEDNRDSLPLPLLHLPSSLSFTLPNLQITFIFDKHAFLYRSQKEGFPLAWKLYDPKDSAKEGGYSSVRRCTGRLYFAGHIDSTNETFTPAVQDGKIQLRMNKPTQTAIKIMPKRANTLKQFTSDRECLLEANNTVLYAKASGDTKPIRQGSDDDNHYLTMAWQGSLDLAEFLALNFDLTGRWYKKNLTPMNIHWIIQGLFKALEPLVSLYKAHGDIKPENIVLNVLQKKGNFFITQVNIVDWLGLRNIETITRSDQRDLVGTMDYFSPEYFLYTKKLVTQFNNEKIDAWAIGLVLIDLLDIKGNLYTHFPKPGQYNGDKEQILAYFEQAIQHLLKQFSALGYRQKTVHLIRQLLQVEPAKRWSIAEAHDHFKCFQIADLVCHQPRNKLDSTCILLINAIATAIVCGGAGYGLAFKLAPDYTLLGGAIGLVLGFMLGLLTPVLATYLGRQGGLVSLISQCNHHLLWKKSEPDEKTMLLAGTTPAVGEKPLPSADLQKRTRGSSTSSSDEGIVEVEVEVHKDSPYPSPSEEEYRNFVCRIL